MERDDGVIELLDSDPEADADGNYLEMINVPEVTTPLSMFGCGLAPGMNGSIWWCAPTEAVVGYFCDRTAQGNARDALSLGDLHRLEEYERQHQAQRKRRRVIGKKGVPFADDSTPPSHTDCTIWDLKQNRAHAGPGSSLLPCLLCRCDAVWLHEAQRPMMPGEALMSQGLPVYRQLSRQCTRSMPFNLEYTCKDMRVGEIFSFAGNGLCLPVSGLFLAWVLCSWMPSQESHLQPPLSLCAKPLPDFVDDKEDEGQDVAQPAGSQTVTGTMSSAVSATAESAASLHN